MLSQSEYLKVKPLWEECVRTKGLAFFYETILKDIDKKLYDKMTSNHSSYAGYSQSLQGSNLSTSRAGSPRLLIDGWRYIQGRYSNEAGIKFKIDNEEWGYTYDINQTYGSPLIKVDGNRYIKEKFGQKNITAGFHTNVNVMGSSTGAIVTYNVAEVLMYDINGNTVPLNIISQNVGGNTRNWKTHGTKNVALCIDRNLSTVCSVGCVIPYEDDADMWIDGEVTCGNQEVVKVEVYFGKSGGGWIECGKGKIHGTPTMYANLNGTRSYIHPNVNGSRGVENTKVTSIFNGSSWSTTVSGW